MARLSSLSPDRVEHRSLALADASVEVRSVDGGPPVFFGHPAVTSTRTAIGDPFTWGFFEELAPTVFDRTLKECDARFLVDHDTSKVVARQSAGDLRLSQDVRGLVAEADLDQEVSYVRDLTRNVETRRVTGMSFGFMVRADTWSSVDVEAVDDKGKTYTTRADLRTVDDVDLVEVSAVTFPAYEDTDAALRAIRLSPPALASRADRVRSSTLMTPRQVGRALDLISELRAGKSLSAASMTALQQVLDQLAVADNALDPIVSAFTAADEAMDSAQTSLAAMLGVPDPDAGDPDEGDGDGPMPMSGSGRSRPTLHPVPTAAYVRAFAARHSLTRP